MNTMLELRDQSISLPHNRQIQKPRYPNVKRLIDFLLIKSFYVGSFIGVFHIHVDNAGVTKTISLQTLSYNIV